jgi:methylmalonyl-CoA/ethylmalonyl-CoA epimerase
MSKFGSDLITQVGMVVKDIEKTAKEWADLLGVPVPPIIVTDPMDKAQTLYCGEPSPARAKLAFFHLGPQVDLELIEPDGNPSTWQDCLDKNGEGVHHIAFNIKGMKDKIAVFEKLGLECVQKGEYTGGRYAYLDAEDNKFKVVFELLEND